MSADLPSTEQDTPSQSAAERAGIEDTSEQHGGSEDEEDVEDDEEEEPKLKYTKLTASLANAYRGGDSTSTFAVAGDKMVLGTHNGNVHILSLPTLQPLRTYHAHSATITGISVSPVLTSTASYTSTHSDKGTTTSPASSVRNQHATSRSSRPPQPNVVPNTLNNQIYIATSSLDGHVCISSLIDPKDVQLRNFARPVQAVALSPDYKNDRTYLSGGLAGSLVLTVGGKAGVSADANTSSAAAAASGWLGSIGLGGGDRGRDSVLHSGEGKIGTIKWSLSGKWVAWVNEEGIKVMRSHLGQSSDDGEDVSWKRIAHAARPNRKGWEEMAGVWRGRAEWIDDKRLEADEESTEPGTNGLHRKAAGDAKRKKVEKLIVGWGDTAWILHVQEGGTGAGGKKQVGGADIVHKLQFRDCIVSGISLYTPSLLAILAYRTRDDDDKPVHAADAPEKAVADKQRKGRSHRQTSLAPQLRLINVVSGEEVDLDELPMSRFESLASQDYHLGSLYVPPPPPVTKAASGEAGGKGALEGLWDVAGGKYASRMFSSGASVMSRDSNGKEDNGPRSIVSPTNSARAVAPPSELRTAPEAHPYASEPGLKLFIQSPYDCVLAVKRELSDHLDWLLKHRQYGQAWQLVHSHSEVIDPSNADATSISSQLSTPSRTKGSLADFFADDNAQQATLPAVKSSSAAEREKRRIGDLWLQQLVSTGEWAEAGKRAGQVLNSKASWEHWVWKFAQASKFDEITPFIPASGLPGNVYEVVLGHYVIADPKRLLSLLEDWGCDDFDVVSVVKAIESRLDSDDIAEDSEEWTALLECLAKLYLATSRASEALRCYIRVRNADRAISVMRSEKLLGSAAAEDVPGLLLLGITREQMRNAPLSTLESSSSEIIRLLANEALRGGVPPETVIAQLDRKGRPFRPFLFFYLRALWDASTTNTTAPADLPPSAPPLRRRKFAPHLDPGPALLEPHADLAIALFAEYSRPHLHTFLRASSAYNFDLAAQICESRHYTDELVHILAKMGQQRRALFLIIDDLGDVKQAIAFARENRDLWDDLLDYGMDKPGFIRGLLEEGGIGADPVGLIRRIPEGLEIEGLREGVAGLLREWSVQADLSEGVAGVLQGEVGRGLDALRSRRGGGVRFDVVSDGGIRASSEKERAEHHDMSHPHGPTAVRPGHCAGCGEPFALDDPSPLLGFPCSHIYHLRCLLDSRPEPSSRDVDDAVESLIEQMPGIHGEERGGEVFGGRSVGGKVARAVGVRRVVGGRCGVCEAADDSS